MENEIEQIKKEIQDLKNQIRNKVDISQFEDIKFYPLLKVGTLYVRTIETSNQF